MSYYYLEFTHILQNMSKGTRKKRMDEVNISSRVLYYNKKLLTFSTGLSTHKISNIYSG